MKYQLIIFDLDGTILDTLEDLSDSLNHTLTQAGYPRRTLAEARSFIGNGIRNLIIRGAPEGTPDETITELHRQFNAYYDLHRADKTAPYPGIPALLTRLKEEGRTLCVVSNKPNHAVGPLCSKYFGTLLDAAYGEREGIPRKPAPDAVLAVMKDYGVLPEQTVYIGDSEVDALTAANSGVDCILVDWGFRDRELLEQAKAKALVSTPKALLDLLLDA
ncbi:MAG: HAD family hydrolase [Oscillospiraceae bacterium]|nr:HAD family hydrolase [Oscillospiraceae bacterium]